VPLIRFGLSVLMAIAATRAVDASESQALLKQLDALVNQDTENESLDDLASLRQAAVEAGPTALPHLRRLLTSRRAPVRYRAAYALAYCGQLESADLLLSEFRRSQNQGIKSLACFALARRGSSSDVRFLVRALSGEHYGDEWPPIQVAALSLGVLRERSAIAPLEITARKTPDSIASGAAEEALSWIREGTYDVSSVSAGDELLPILAVMSHGVPRMSESEAFFELAAHRLWKRQGRKWQLEPSQSSPDQVPSISFETFVSADGKRATVAVGVTFGPLNGVGYDYLLSNNAGSWKVIGILPTWIS
jgi:HEAT repeat protein